MRAPHKFPSFPTNNSSACARLARGQLIGLRLCIPFALQSARAEQPRLKGHRLSTCCLYWKSLHGSSRDLQNTATRSPKVRSLLEILSRGHLPSSLLPTIQSGLQRQTGRLSLNAKPPRAGRGYIKLELGCLIAGSFRRTWAKILCVAAGARLPYLICTTSGTRRRPNLK